MDSDFAEAIASIGHDPCADCGRVLGKNWRERYNPDTGRLDKVHITCPSRDET